MDKGTQSMGLCRVGHDSDFHFPDGASGKELACQCRGHKRLRFDPWVGKIPWRRAWQPTVVFLPGESHGPRSLVGYSPWGHKELDTTEHIIVLRHLMYRRHSLNVENQSECGDSFLKISYKLCVCV